MSVEILKQKILTLIPEAVFDETAQWPVVSIDGSQWLSLAQKLRSDDALSFDYLFCVTGVDWKTHLSMVYHLESTKHRHILVVKAKIEDRSNPKIDSVSAIWRTAEFHEREAYDLFGVKFVNHPDLRRLFLTEEWVGWPLRKDYEDAVNMIKL
jgi:NADH/F420H2 dehydrogenase subunit C